MGSGERQVRATCRPDKGPAPVDKRPASYRNFFEKLMCEKQKKQRRQGKSRNTGDKSSRESSTKH